MQSERTLFSLSRFVKVWCCALGGCLLLMQLPGRLEAQRGRINGPIDNSRRTTLNGHLNPRTAAASDQGRIDPSRPLPYVTMVFQPSASPG